MLEKFKKFEIENQYSIYGGCQEIDYHQTEDDSVMR